MNFRMKLRPSLWLAGLLSVVLSCQTLSAQQYEWEGKIREAISESKFAEAAAALDKLDLTGPEQKQKEWYYELMRRIRIEFPYNEEQIKELLKKDGKDTSDAKMREWES